MREELLQRLVDQKLLGPTRQVMELCPGDLPVRELPPGNNASLYLMYLAFQRLSHSKPASKSTFYNVSKQWSCCLRFRRKCEHAMCAVCQSLKARIHEATDPWCLFVNVWPICKSWKFG